MDISLDKPGFGVVTTDAEVNRSDPPRSSGSSTTSSGESTRRSCSKCHGRMSSLSLDKHLFCMKCRGSECTVDTRCNECFSWTEEEMIRYVKLRKSLSSKSKRSKSSPPRSIPPERDTDEFNQSQLDSVQKMINDSVSSMSDKLMAKFSSMMDQFQARQHDIPLSSSSAVPGQSATRTEPVSQPTESRALRVVDFGRATRTRYRRRTLVFAIVWTRLLRLLGIFQGMPESLGSCAELQPSSGITRLELGLFLTR